MVTFKFQQHLPEGTTSDPPKHTLHSPPPTSSHVLILDVFCLSVQAHSLHFSPSLYSVVLGGWPVWTGLAIWHPVGLDKQKIRGQEDYETGVMHPLSTPPTHPWYLHSFLKATALVRHSTNSSPQGSGNFSPSFSPGRDKGSLLLLALGFYTIPYFLFL